jgi:hypothetical protein
MAKTARESFVNAPNKKNWVLGNFTKNLKSVGTQGTLGLSEKTSETGAESGRPE